MDKFPVLQDKRFLGLTLGSVFLLGLSFGPEWALWFSGVSSEREDGSSFPDSPFSGSATQGPLGFDELMALFNAKAEKITALMSLPSHGVVVMGTDDGAIRIGY